jgi:hypothetical protein
MVNATSRRVTRWADLVAIVAGVCALGNAMWGPLIFTAMERSTPRGDPGIGYTWEAFGIGGLLALTAVVLAQKWPRPARVLLAIAGLMLLAVPFTYVKKEALPIAASVILGLAMLVATPFLGTMPAPRRTASPGDGELSDTPRASRPRS